MQKKRILILGGGISGLSLAYYLAKQKDLFDIHLLEKSERPGGWIDSDNSTGFFFEKGPRVFRGSKSQEFLSLVSDIGMDKEMIPCNPEATGRYIWSKGRLRKAPILSWGLLKGAFRDLYAKPLGKDESVWDFACRRFNSQVAQDVFDPLVTGIYGGNMKEISIKLGFPQFKALEEKYGSVIKGLLKSPKFQGPRMFSFQRGMKSFIKKLEEMTPVHFHYGEEITAIHSRGEGFEVKTSKGTYEADFLFSALPCHIIGRLLFPQLLNISFHGTTLVHLGYHQKVLKKKGFGYLVASQENDDLLGVVFDSNSFTQFNRSPEETRLTVMLKREDVSDGEARDLAIKSLKNHLKIKDQPDVSLVLRAPKVFPQLKVGHEKILSDVEAVRKERYPSLRLVGNYFYGVGVNDCIARAKSVSDIFLSETVS
jgi:protoporphyrinogen/coproporphyrinogen III oxidase